MKYDLFHFHFSLFHFFGSLLPTPIQKVSLSSWHKERIMSIEVKHLTKYYGQQAAVNDISFSVGKGEIVGFLGPNGAGKSTTMKIITGFIPATEGQVYVCGMNVEEQSLEARKRIGYLPENNPLYLDMYVKEYLEFAARLNGMKNADKRIEEKIFYFCDDVLDFCERNFWSGNKRSPNWSKGRQFAETRTNSPRSGRRSSII